VHTRPALRIMYCNSRNSRCESVVSKVELDSSATKSVRRHHVAMIVETSVHASDELSDRERFRDKVDGTPFQTVDPDVDRAMSGQDEDSLCRVVCRQSSQYHSAVDVGHPEVKNDEVGCPTHHQSQSAGAVGGTAHLVTCTLERAYEEGANLPLVVDDENRTHESPLHHSEVACCPAH